MSDYSCELSYYNDSWEYEDWTVSLEATATYIHEDMVMYYKDGSGHPGCDDIEDVDYTINSITDKDGKELQLNDEGYPVNWTEEQIKAMDSAIHSYLDTVDWDYPEPDYPEDD